MALPIPRQCLNMVKVSLNEIYSETYKAYRSVGLEWGIAKDSAILSKWLGEYGFNFLGPTLKTIDLYNKGEISLSLKENSYKKPFYGALMGLPLVEYVSACKIKWQGYVYDYKFLIAAMAIIAKEQNINLILSDNKKTIAYTLKKNIYMIKEVITKTEYFYLEPYHFKENTNINELKPRRNSTALDVNEKHWEKLKLLAFKTYVPESRTSKSGAGY